MPPLQYQDDHQASQVTNQSTGFILYLWQIFLASTNHRDVLSRCGDNSSTDIWSTQTFRRQYNEQTFH